VLSSSPQATLSDPTLTWAGDIPIFRPTPKGKDYVLIEMLSADSSVSPPTTKQTMDDSGTYAQIAAGDRRITVSYRRIPRETDDHPDIAPLIKAAEDAAELASPAEPWQEWEGQIFASVGVCAGCHPAQAERWTQTKHAYTWELLAIDDSQGNLDCVRCHTTGYGLDGGFLRAASVGSLTGVQCEVCHGPSLQHAYAPEAVSTPHTVPPEATCLSCHQEDRSIGFSYIDWLPRATCTPPNGP